LVGREAPSVYVLMSGLPASGKSTVAAPLATALGWPLLSKDALKEALWDTLGPGDREWSARLGAAAQEQLLRLAQVAPAAVIDTFVHRAWRDRWRALPGVVAEVHCRCPAELVRARCAQRRRHPCHFDAEQLADRFDDWVRDDARPLALGGPVLEVDTSGAGPVDVATIAAIAAWVRENTPR
jgi:predicted kinase